MKNIECCTEKDKMTLNSAALFRTAMTSKVAFVAMAFFVFAIMAITAVSAAPIIQSYSITPTEVVEGNNISVSGIAVADGSCITSHRFYVAGSQGGVWTNVSCLQNVMLNGEVPTAENERSFYDNPGVYSLVWEVRDQSGQTTTRIIEINVNSAGQNPPTIISYSASPNPIAQGNNVTITGTANAGSNCITAHRVFVVGSQGGVWTNVSCLQSVSIGSSHSTSQNERSFYQNPNTYTLRWEVVDSQGRMTAQDIPLTVTLQVNNTNTSNIAPTIQSFNVFPSLVIEGNNVTITGTANAGSNCITAHRVFVVGSQGGVWTNVSCLQSVSVNSNVPTMANNFSFYRNPGNYTLRWEVVDSQGRMTAQERFIGILSANSSNDTIPPATVTNLIAIETTQNSITWNWTRPADLDFYGVLVYLNGMNVLNTTANNFSATGLNPATQYTITVYTIDIFGNINPNGVSMSTFTQGRTSSSGGSSGSRAGITYFDQEDENPLVTFDDSEPIYLSEENNEGVEWNSSKALLIMLVASCLVLIVILGVIWQRR